MTKVKECDNYDLGSGSKKLRKLLELIAQFILMYNLN
jgi:hypothetical protein